MRAACAGCPVHRECLLHAVAHEDQGYWAGTTAGKRRKIRKSLGVRLQTNPVL